MSRLVLHIGTHKTASTTVQDMMHANAALLRDAGVIYPSIGRHSGHHALVADWAKLARNFHVPEGGEAALRALVKDHADSDRTLFLSSEEFSRGHPDGRTDMALLSEIVSAFSEVEVLVVVKEQWHLLQSIYLEVSKSRQPMRLPELVEHACDTGMASGLWLDYGKLFDHLLTGFAAEQIRFVDYRSASSQPGGIVGFFLRHLSAGLDVADLELINDGRSNASPLALGSWAANAIAAPDTATKSLVNMASGAYTAEFGERPSCIFTRAEINAIRKRFDASNERLAQRLEKTQGTFRLSASPLSKDTVHREDIGPGFWLRCSRRLHHKWA
ncbi:hypothetical protein [Primorskyibacter sedentarius]|nr:hypothetical protein [Primorskyibacter sedentarius]